MAESRMCLRCPKCNSYECQLIEEIIVFRITKTNKQTGWLNKNKKEVGESKFYEHFECNNCGYGFPKKAIDNEKFIIDKEIK